MICLYINIAIAFIKLNGFNYCNLTQIFLFNFNFAQSAGAVEYTDCTSAEG